MKVENSKGKIYYGMHFYPGVAEYAEPGVEPYRIYLNENTIRSMDASFAGRPIFVEHVDAVEEDVNALRSEADGWVIESFYNQADGKHWVKFIVVSDYAERAIQSGFKLSNAFIPNSFGGGGDWNGVSYSKEVLSAEYEHLAIVDNPRYAESVIYTPEQFKQYNNDNLVEVRRIANSKEKEKMKLKFWKQTKVENSADLSGVMVELPKSKKEMSIVDLVAKYDAVLNMNGYANGDHMVKVGEDEMSVNDLVKKHMEMQNASAEADEIENAGEGEPGEDIENEDDDESMDNDSDEEGTIAAGVKDVSDRGGDESLMNEDEVEEPAQPKKKKNALEQARADKLARIANAKKVAAKKAAIKTKNDALKNAHLNAVDEESCSVDLACDQVARGKARYGSN